MPGREPMLGRLETHGRRGRSVAARLILCVSLLLPPAALAGASAGSARAADPDRDGLSTGRERRLRLRPHRWDTDRDRLSDGDEVLRCKTNPRRRDTDRDGLSDGREVLKSFTDPRHA